MEHMFRIRRLYLSTSISILDEWIPVIDLLQISYVLSCVCFVFVEELTMASDSPPAEIAVPQDDRTDRPDKSAIFCEDFVAEVVNSSPADRVVTLLAMFTGLPFEVDAENEEPFCKYEKRSEFRLTKKVLTAEAKRRFATYAEIVEKVPNSHKSNQVFVKYLKDNPIDRQACIDWLQAQKHGIVNQYEILVNTLPANGTNTAQWRGNKPWLRMYHVILQDREQFLRRDDPLTRSEIDRPNKPSYWEWAAGVYNDLEFKPKTSMYPLLHHDFAFEIELDTEGIPLPCSADILKKKMTDARYKLLDMIRKYDQSGNGDGSVLDPEDGEDPYIADAQEKCAFLGSYNSHILYLWELCDDYDLLNSVKSVLLDECVVTGSTIGTCSFDVFGT